MVQECKQRGLEAHVVDLCVLPWTPLHASMATGFQAAYAMNSLLHIPKGAMFAAVLAEAARLVVPGGLFYLGVYGGESFEGKWEEDPSGEARFFAYYTDAELREAIHVAGGWEIELFRKVDTAIRYPTTPTVPKPSERAKRMQLHFQSVVLRRQPA